jgi:methylmalonyl-CoA/ethylmalonyl-CoA epimerase
MFHGVDHVVIAVTDLDQGIAKFEAIFGQKVSRTGEPPGAGFKNAYFDFEHSQIELVAPTNDTGPIGRRIASTGEGVHLVAMRCDDLEGTVAKLRAQGVRLIGDPGEGKPVTGQVFVHPSAAGGVLLQLVRA